MLKRYLILQERPSVNDVYCLTKLDYSKMPVFRTHRAAVKWLKGRGEFPFSYIILPVYSPKTKI